MDMRLAIWAALPIIVIAAFWLARRKTGREWYRGAGSDLRRFPKNDVDRLLDRRSKAARLGPA